jgi:hypothetical protein
MHIFYTFIFKISIEGQTVVSADSPGMIALDDFLFFEQRGKSSINYYLNMKSYNKK